MNAATLKELPAKEDEHFYGVRVQVKVKSPQNIFLYDQNILQPGMWKKNKNNKYNTLKYINHVWNN